MSLLQKLATEARAINAANGWGLDFDASNKAEIPAYLALIHSEISEAWGARSRAEMNLELGDVVIRCLDLCELLEPGSVAHTQAERFIEVDSPFNNWNRELLALHARTSEALEVYRKETPFVPGLRIKLVTIAQHSMRLMRRTGSHVDPEGVIREILVANSKRGYRHGGRRT